MTRRTAERGVWLIERKWGASEWETDPTRSPIPSCSEARLIAKTYGGKERDGLPYDKGSGWKLRAVRYIPAAPKPSRAKRRKKR